MCNTEPVKVTFFTKGCRQSASLNDGVLFRLVVKTLNTPFVNPANSAKCTNVRMLSGVSGLGLMSIEQPAASAALAFRSIIAMGKFHGTSATATPIGCLMVKTRRLGAEGT